MARFFSFLRVKYVIFVVNRIIDGGKLEKQFITSLLIVKKTVARSSIIVWKEIQRTV